MKLNKEVSEILDLYKKVSSDSVTKEEKLAAYKRIREISVLITKEVCPKTTPVQSTDQVQEMNEIVDTALFGAIECLMPKFERRGYLNEKDN